MSHGTHTTVQMSDVAVWVGHEREREREREREEARQRENEIERKQKREKERVRESQRERKRERQNEIHCFAPTNHYSHIKKTSKKQFDTPDRVVVHGICYTDLWLFGLMCQCV